MDRRKLTLNEKSPTAMARDFKSVVTGFDGPVTDKKNLITKSPLNTILTTVARYAMSFRFNCACLSKKHIYSFYHTRANTANWPVDILEPCLDMGQPSTYHWLITMYGKGGRTL